MFISKTNSANNNRESAGGNPTSAEKLIIGLPAGSLKEATLALFRRAGFRISVEDRSYSPSIDDSEIECLLIRAQEIPIYVEQGILDLGITGNDWIQEMGAEVIELGELIYSKKGFNPVSLCLAVPENSPIKTIEGLEGKRIATELVSVTKKYLEKNNVRASVEFSWGATESKPPRLCDAIAELVDSGKSLQANNLKIIGVIMESTTRLITNRSARQNKWKREKMENIALLLKGALAAENMVGLKMNSQKKNLRALISALPPSNKPTVADLSEKGWVALEAILEENEVKKLIPLFKKIGAEKIVEYPLNKIIV